MFRQTAFIGLLLFILSCSQDKPTAQDAFDVKAGPWQTVEINGALYRRVAAKPISTAQGDLLITIPIRWEATADGAIRLSDTVEIAGRIYTADCASQEEDTTQRTEEGDRTQLAEMRREIDALVGDAAGASIEDCRYAGVGSKPCGGPWEFVIYSASSTDSTALAERLTAYNAFEAEMNERYGYASDCSVPNMPVLAYRDGRCVAE